MPRLLAVFLMIVVTLLWSTAGVVTRHLDSAASFEVTFWRSLFTALAIAVWLTGLRGLSLWRNMLHAPKTIWISGGCWSIMFTAFMLAITLTTVANVLIVMALGPLITAIFTRIFLKHRLPWITWLAIAVAGIGIIKMFSHGDDATLSVSGSLVALGVPLAAALNFTILQYVGLGKKTSDEKSKETSSPDMLQSVLIGAIISVLFTLPLSFPFQATAHDIFYLSALGLFQLALPCLMLVRLTRELSAPEVSLLAQLELVFGVTWVWLWGGEPLSNNTLSGGLLVLGALVLNEVARMARARKATLSQRKKQKRLNPAI